MQIHDKVYKGYRGVCLICLSLGGLYCCCHTLFRYNAAGAASVTLADSWCFASYLSGWWGLGRNWDVLAEKKEKRWLAKTRTSTNHEAMQGSLGRGVKKLNSMGETKKSKNQRDLKRNTIRQGDEMDKRKAWHDITTLRQPRWGESDSLQHGSAHLVIGVLSSLPLNGPNTKINLEDWIDLNLTFCLSIQLNTIYCVNRSKPTAESYKRYLFCKPLLTIMAIYQFNHSFLL